MRVGPARYTNADFEGLHYVTVIDDDGLTHDYWMSEEDMEHERTKVTCGRCCHHDSSIVDHGTVREGKLNGKPIEQVVRTKESGW